MKYLIAFINKKIKFISIYSYLIFIFNLILILSPIFFKYLTIKNDTDIIFNLVKKDLYIGDKRNAIETLNLYKEKFDQISLISNSNKVSLMEQEKNNTFRRFFNLKVYKKLDDSNQVEFTFSILNVFLVSIFFVLVFSFINNKYKNYLISKKIKAYELNKSIENSLKLFSTAQKLAHDIRSPISTLSIISKKLDNTENKQLIDSIILQINSISNDLLEKSKLNMSQTNTNTNSTELHDSQEVKTAKISFSSLFSQLQKEYLIKSEHLKRNINFDLDSNVSSISDFAPDFLYSSVNNLIQNSIEATENNSNPIITIKTELSQNNVFILTIVDNGVGIQPELLNRLGYEKISFGKAQSSSGSGIALFNLKESLNRINGSLNINSTPNTQTTICLSIPVSVF